MGRELQGHLSPARRPHLRLRGRRDAAAPATNLIIDGLASDEAEEFLGDRARPSATRSSSCAGAAHAFDLEDYRAGSRRRCSSARRSTTSASRSCSLRSSTMRPAPLPRADARAHRRAARSAAHRIRVQDPGEHGPGPSRPHRVPAHLLGPLRSAACGCSTCGSARKCASAMRSPSWRPIAADRRSVRRRHHRPAQPRHDQHRRHVHRRREARCSRACRTSRRSCSAARCCGIRCA